jgi:hypothetical protein
MVIQNGLTKNPFDSYLSMPINLTTEFFKAYWKPGMKSVYTKIVPKEMMASPIDKDGWYEWKLITSTLTVNDYQKLEDKFKVRFPTSFINWHSTYFFADCDLSIIRLPNSFPTVPLKSVADHLDWYVAEKLISQGLIPFADEGNDTGPLVFDTRNRNNENDFPIRVYDHEYMGDLSGLSDVIFSSFSKMLECLTHLLNESKTKNQFHIIPDFFKIDPDGAGLTGRSYFNLWT